MIQKLKTWATVLALLAALLFAAPAAANYIYQYTDENGHVHFTDDPGNVPEDKRSEMKEIQRDPTERKPDQVKSLERGSESPQLLRRQVPDDSNSQIPSEPDIGIEPVRPPS